MKRIFLFAVITLFTLTLVLINPPQTFAAWQECPYVATNQYTTVNGYDVTGTRETLLEVTPSCPLEWTPRGIKITYSRPKSPDETSIRYAVGPPHFLSSFYNFVEPDGAVERVINASDFWQAFTQSGNRFYLEYFPYAFPGTFSVSDLHLYVDDGLPDPTPTPSPTPTPTPEPSVSPSPSPSIEPSPTPSPSPTPTPEPQITSLGPVNVWVGLKNSDDVGIKFDLKADVYKNANVIGSGEVTSVAAGSSGFNNAKLDVIPITLGVPQSIATGDQLTYVISVRNACTGSTHNSGTARLWYNDATANSGVSLAVDGNTSNYYLQSSFVLGSLPGSGPRSTIDLAAGAKCSPYKTFGSWMRTL